MGLPLLFPGLDEDSRIVPASVGPTHPGGTGAGMIGRVQAAATAERVSSIPDEPGSWGRIARSRGPAATRRLMAATGSGSFNRSLIVRRWPVGPAAIAEGAVVTSRPSSRRRFEARPA